MCVAEPKENQPRVRSDLCPLDSRRLCPSAEPILQVGDRDREKHPAARGVAQPCIRRRRPHNPRPRDKKNGCR